MEQSGGGGGRPLLLVNIALMVVLFPVGWLVSKRLYYGMLAYIGAAIWILVVGTTFWRWITGDLPFAR